MGNHFLAMEKSFFRAEGWGIRYNNKAHKIFWFETTGYRGIMVNASYWQTKDFQFESWSRRVRLGCFV